MLVLDATSTLPKVAVKVKDTSPMVSKLFGGSPTKSRALIRNERRLKAIQDSLKPGKDDIPWYSTFNKLTGYDIQVKLVTGEKRDATTTLEALQQISDEKPKLKEAEEAPDVIQFEERRPDGLPKSIKEKHEIQRGDGKRRDKKAHDKDRTREHAQRSTEKHELKEEKVAESSSKWSEVYSSAKGGITGLMQQQTNKIIAESKKKDKKKGAGGDKKKFKLGFNL